MSELISLQGEFKFSNWFVWSLNHLVRLLPAKQLAISLTVEGEEAAQELLTAYACGIRHFPGSILEQAELYQAKLPNIILTAARLREADICEADLRRADFRHADLRDANLIESNLVGANLSGSDLTEHGSLAQTLQVQIYGVRAYKEHCVYLGILEENAFERGWTVENLRGKYIVVAGGLKPAPKCQAIEDIKPTPRRCWHIIAKEWGAAGIIKEELVAILPHPTGVEWVEPTILEVEVSSLTRQQAQSLDVEEQVIADEQAVAEETESVTYPGEQLETSEVTDLPEEKGGGSVSDSSSLETLSTQPQIEQPKTQNQSTSSRIEISKLPDPSDDEEDIYSFQGSAQPSRQSGSDSKASGNFNRQPIQTKSKAQFSARSEKRKGLFNRLKKVVKRILRAAFQSLVRFFRN